MSTVPTATPLTLDRYELPGNLASLAALASSGQITIRPHELIRTTDGRVYHWTTSALEIVSAPVHHGTVADVAALDGIYLLPGCTRGVHPGDTAYVTAAGCEYRVTSGVNATATWAACATFPSIPTTPSEVGADPSGTAATAVATHNTATDSHADIRTSLAGKQPSLTISTVGTALLNISTPTAAKIPRINADGSVTLIDVPTGGGGSVPGPLEILGVRGDHLWADPAMLTGYTDGQAITDSINTYTLGPRTSVNLRLAGAPIYLSGVLNGHPVANFSGTAALTAISHAACSGQPFTAYFVLKFASLANAYTALLGPVSNAGFFVKSTGKSSWYSSGANYDGSGTVTYSVGTWYILTVRVGFGGLVVRANGVTDYAAASRSYAFSDAGQQIVVGNQLGQGGRGMYGQIAAFILADAEHTDGEVSIVESALASRFAL